MSLIKIKKLVSFDKYAGLYLLLFSILIRYYFVFFISDYQSYIFSDMRNYWNGAVSLYQGHFFSKRMDWLFGAPQYHVFLSLLLHLYDLIGLGGFELERTLSFGILLTSLSVYWLYRLCLDLFKSRTTAFLVAFIYSATYPFIYFNACVLTENVAIPLLIFSNYLLFMQPSKKSTAFAGSLVFAIASGIRPMFLPFILPMGALLFYLNHKNKKTAFMLGGIYVAVCFTCVLLFCTYNNYVSDGKCRGLSANGGAVFYMTKCKVREFKAIWPGYWIDVSHCSYPAEPPYTKQTVYRPIYDEEYFYKQGFACIEKNPLQLVTIDMRELRFFFNGPMFPSINVPHHYALVQWSNYLHVPAFIIAFFVLPFFFRRMPGRNYRAKIIFLWSLLFINFAEAYWLGADRRYSLATVYVEYILFAVFVVGIVPIRRLLKSSVDVRRTYGFFFMIVIIWTSFWVLPYIPNSQHRKSELKVYQVLKEIFEKPEYLQRKLALPTSFNGYSDYVDLGSGLSDYSNGMTIAFWAYPTETIVFARFIDLGNGAMNDNIIIGRSDNSNDLQLEVWKGNKLVSTVSAPNAIDLRHWQHFIVTFNAQGKIRMYKNGLRIMDGWIQIPNVIDRGRNYLGKSNWPVSHGYFKGKIKDFYIFNKGLDLNKE